MVVPPKVDVSLAVYTYSLYQGEIASHFGGIIKDQSSDLTVFDEALVKRWLKQITIWDDHCTVELKSGLKVDVEK